MTALLEVENLYKTFQLTRSLIPWQEEKLIHAVQGVSFSIADREVLGLVGESGSGKSTVARCLLGLERPTSGTIHFQGRDISILSHGDFRPLRREIQMVFQDPASSLNPHMTAAQIIEEPLRLLTDLSPSERRGRTSDMLSEVGLSPDLARRHRHQLSGGQQQRVSIGRALALHPSLLVLDEPVSALDASVQAQVLGLLRSLQEKHGLSYLFISHDLDTVKAVCDRVGIMRRGRIVEMGSVSQIFDTPLHPYTKLLLGSRLDLDPAHRRSDHSTTREGEPIPAQPDIQTGAGRQADGDAGDHHLVDAGRAHLVESWVLASWETQGTAP